MSETKHAPAIWVTNSFKIIWTAVFLLLPLFFLTITTETFVLPKQVVIAFATLASLLIFGIKALIEKKVKFRETFLDLPILLFIVSLGLSVIFSVDRITSLTTFIPILFLGLSYFIITNTIREEQTAFLFVSALLVSATITALLSIFSFLKTYLFPFAFTHVQSFSPFGSLTDQAIYFAVLLPISLYFAYPIMKGKNNAKVLSFSFTSLILIGGLAITVYQLFTTQKPVILPFSTGFQIAFASISQDSARIAQGFFLGSGTGTFFTAFTRFKQPAFNLYPTIWFLNFTQSTSFVLEILTTTGLLGTLSFLFVLGKALGKPLKTLDNPIFFAIVVLGIATFVFPFSYTLLALFFFLLAIFSSTEGLKSPDKSFDLELSLIALKKNLFNVQTEQPTHKPSQVLPIIFIVLIIAFTAIIGYFSARYVIADVIFNQSLAAASNNNGSLTYQKQVQAINIYPYRDGFYRIFSQTNLSIANSLLALNTNTNNQSGQNTQSQQTALSLIQQSITVARTATTLSPANTLNWQNLASIYKALINVGQNADSFSIASTQQAMVLDSSNPQEYLSLGGLYYQLGQYDNALRQFQIAVNLKPDFPNAYYNLGHAYEAKGDLQNALSNYQTVRSLISNDKTNFDKINAEIDALSKKISASTTGSTQQNQIAPQATVTPVQNQPPLNIEQPTTQLPQQKTQVKIPGPTGTIKPTSAATPTPKQ